MSDPRVTTPPARHARGWPLLAVLGAGVVVIVVAWFTFGRSLTSSGDDSKPPYVEAVVGAPSHVNPLYAYLNDVDRDLSSLVFSGLVRLGPDGQVQPDLAQSWDISSDDKQFTFHLRPGVSWHTGVAFTADDVLFTFRLLADPKLQGDPDQVALWSALQCTAPDPMTVACTLPFPYAPFLSYASIGILPNHILQNVAPLALYDDAFNKSPIGTGPYRLAELDHTRAVLKANGSYYLGVPLIDEIQFRFYPNSSSAAADVVRGQAQGFLVDLTASQQDFATLSSTSGLKAHTATRSAYTALYLNNSTAPLNDVAVRRAIAYTVNASDIVDKLLGGRGVPADSPIPPGTWAHSPDIRPYSHDPGQARDILDAAGWIAPEGGKVRARNGVELRLSLITDQDTLRGAIADAIAKELAEVGIEATVARQPSSSLVKDFLIPRTYQAAIYGWDPGADPDPYPGWHSSQASGNGRNLASYRNDAADKLMEDARRTNDLDQRRSLYYTFQESFKSDVPSVLLYYPTYTYFLSAQLGKVELGTLFTNASRFNNVSQWTLEKAPDIAGG